MVYVIQTALELGFMYALVAMALFLSYRILDIADLTTDSGFVLGAAVSVTVAAAGHPFLAILAAMAAGLGAHLRPARPLRRRRATFTGAHCPAGRGLSGARRHFPLVAQTLCRPGGL